MENIILNTKKHLGRKQVILDCKFNIENGKEVEKILSVQANPLILNTNCVSAHLNYGGKLDTNLLYVTPNGEKVSLIAIADFNEVFENQEIEENSIAELECKIVDITTPSIKSNEVKVACILDINISIICEKENKLNCDIDNILTKNSFKTTTRHLCKINENFDFNEELKIEDSLNQILKIDTNFSVKDCYCGNGYAVVDGICFMSIMYEDENNNIKQHKTQFQIKQEVECENASSECFANLTLKPLCYLSKTVVTQENNFNLIKYELPIQIFGNVFILEDLNCIEDAYSKTHLVECNFNEISCIKTINSHFCEDSCKGIVNMPNGKNINIVAFTNPSIEIANHSILNDNLSIEGVISTNILYTSTTQNENEDSTTILLPVIAEFGFSSTISNNKFENISDIKINTNISDLEINIKNNEIEIIVKLNYWIYITQEEKIHLLTSIEEKNTREPSSSALEIFFAEKDQELWDLAKEIGLSEEEILKQNPNLKEFIESGTKIVIYHKAENN